MFRPRDFFDRFFAAYRPLFRTVRPLGSQNWSVPVDHIYDAGVAEYLEAVAAAVAEVRRVADHEILRISPQGMHVVGARKLVLVLPRVCPAQTDAARRKFRPGNIMHQVDEVTA